MKLTFLGTRGEINAKSRRHRRHAVLRVSYRGKDVMIDCGENWRREVHRLKPHGIVITHAHPDHALGLKDGSPCMVYATEDAWAGMAEYPIPKARRRTVVPRRAFTVQGIRFEAFPLEHSLRAPAVGYRIIAGKADVFYAPDLVYIHDRDEALTGTRLYIGDGATVTRSFVRKRAEHLIGHTPVRTQLTWCRKTGVPEMIVTHCGSQIVKGDERVLGAKLRKMARERGVKVVIAHDGMERILRG